MHLISQLAERGPNPRQTGAEIARGECVCVWGGEGVRVGKQVVVKRQRTEEEGTNHKYVGNTEQLIKQARASEPEEERK